MASRFLSWLDAPPSARWLDVGCGTGALTETILHARGPTSVHGIDPAEDFVAFARGHLRDPIVSFEVGDARAIPATDHAFDIAVSGLVLNFVPEPDRAASEMRRVTRPGGTLAAYVWDYAEGMQMMRVFWDAATELDPEAKHLDEGIRFPLCRPGPLADLWTRSGMREVEIAPIDVDTVFRDADDYWMPFLGGQGPAPSYAVSRSDEDREALRQLIASRLPVAGDGSIHLTARAWAVRGTA